MPNVHQLIEPKMLQNLDQELRFFLIGAGLYTASWTAVPHR